MPRLLLVDDEDDIRNMLKLGLETRGHTVDVAGSAEQALKVASKAAYQYDAVIVDYVLPGMRGLELLNALRKRNPFLRSLVISGQIDHDELEPHILEQQLKEEMIVDKYLPKPVAIDDLDSAIRASLMPGSAKADDWKAAASNAVDVAKIRPTRVKAVERRLSRVSRSTTTKKKAKKKASR